MPQRYSTVVYKRDLPWWAYDVAIVIGLFVFGWLAYRVHPAFGIGAAILLWGSFVEPRLLGARRYVVGAGGSTLRVVFLSDMHVGPYKGERWMRRVVARAMRERPDLVLLGGDFIYHDPEDARRLRPLSALKARCGVFAILGNHDERFGNGEVRSMLDALGIRVLRNASSRFRVGSDTVSVVGVVDDWYAETDIARSLEGVEAGDRVLMMVHNPDLAPHAAKALGGRTKAPSLMLSGHTHGGQIRLPLVGPVPPLPHHLGRKYDRGLFDMRGVPYVIGEGVGESGPRARLFCPPRVITVDLSL